MRILIGVDGSREANVACAFVERRAWPSGTRVSLLGVVEQMIDWSGLAPASGRTADSGRAALDGVLAERADALRRHGLMVEMGVEFGRARELLLDRAAHVSADLIVVGSRGLGPTASAVFGSVSAHIVDHAACPVLVVRSPDATRMLLATDGTPSSHRIPSVLASWGHAFRGMPVEVLSVAPRDTFVTPWGAIGEGDAVPADDAGLLQHETIAERVAGEMTKLGWDAAAAARAGDPGRQIVSAGVEWGADLVITGSRDLGTLRRLVLGSVAHDVLLHARASVLVMHGQVAAWISQAAPAVGSLASA